MNTKTLPAAGGLTADDLRALPEGTVVVTYGVAWAKIGPDEWRCPFKEHVPGRDVGQPRVFRWQDQRDSEWLAKVATLVVFDPREYAL